ncbi:Enoyl-[acyl-carrier-protein] reductase [NADH] FabI [Legionella pneumophila]|nr:Enoyl-[acyl-carrier-protein] reductase [NADH] FabI [Legionella pneumophila]
MTHLKGLIVGVANEDSIAWGCANILHETGSELAITYQNEKTKEYVQPLVNKICCPIFMPLDVRNDMQLEALFQRIKTHWGKLDFIIHAIAFAPKSDLQGTWWIAHAMAS